jgi:histidinol dehydrogenase
MKRVVWKALSEGERRAVLARPAGPAEGGRTEAVARLIAAVRAGGDRQLRTLTRRYDRAEPAALRVDADEFAAAERTLAPDLALAIEEARARIELFHRAGAPRPFALETAAGVRCERVLRPIRRGGLYVPAGSAPLPSTALMLGVPAQLAGCATVVLCTPPRPDGLADAAVLFAAQRCGIREVFKLGGAQAIAAMAYGTESVPKCDKIFGPGNAWVTEAKRQVAQDPDGAAVDLPAGPSELLVIADAAADPRYVAADLLSQAEHGPDSQVLLLSDDAALVDRALVELDRQLAQLPRRETARQALASSSAIVVESIAQALALSNGYAPEHLILQVREPRSWLPRVEAAGSVFLGAHSPEAIGDYVSGANHVLPTGGAARAQSGLSVASFMTQITVQELEPAGLAALAPAAMKLARAEGLVGHERAVSMRLPSGAEAAA